ncbi:hypothetical protein FB446DRAFT_795241 [Lentinula raphanica]|nr:hypothetical protein FB446DRAFT_795241 [Lentinula raphanica]
MPKEKNTDENEPRSLERVEETDQEEKIPEAMKVDGEWKALIPYRGWPILVPEKRLNMEIQASLRNDSMAFKAWFMLTQGACLCRPWTSLPLRREKISSSWDPHIDEHFGRVLLEPLHRSIRKLILKDEYVSFEKHLAGIDPEYDHKDEGQDFGGGYA